MSDMAAGEGAGIDKTRPSPGRIYDYLLGGVDNFEADRMVADRLLELQPDLKDSAWANRGFLQRATKWLAEHGIDQFLDIGAGLPTRYNTHETAQEVHPDAHVVYVDNDPSIVAHGQQLLSGTPNTAYISGDFTDVEGILGHPSTCELLDFDRPVGLLAIALLHFVPDTAKPVEVLRRYVDAIPSGSYIVMSHGTADCHAPQRIDQGKQVYSAASAGISPRSKEEVRVFLEGLEIVEPYPGADLDLTFVSLWGAENPADADSEGGRIGYCAVARKP